MRKLGTRQRHVLERMAEGWKLGEDRWPSCSNWWLQEGKLCGGGATERVHANSARSLHGRGLIKPVGYRYPITHYALTDTGRAALKERPDA